MDGDIIIEGKRKRGRPRGKPFAKGNNKGKAENEILDDKGLAVGDEGRALTLPPVSMENGRTEHEGDGLNYQLPKEAVESILALQQTIKENMNNSQEEKLMPEIDRSLDLIEELHFTSGENKVSLRFSRRHNRMYRIQIFLNDEYEIRPTTYSGVSTGMNFWNLLKGVLKK